MTTTIVPGSGQGALLTQQGPGTSPGYSALDIRRLYTGALQEGVYGTSTTVTAGGVSGVAAADFMVTQRGAGANLSVDINMPGGGMAFVQGDTIAGQGLYGVPVAAANINEAIGAADLTNPRVDQVILEVQDNVLDASGGNLARTRVLTGTPTSGATLTNRSGAPTLPGSALLLADVLVAANATTIPNSAIRDRRKWARGAHWFNRVVYSSSQALGAGLNVFAPVDPTNFYPRIECSGLPLEIALDVVLGSSVNQNILFQLRVDGANQPTHQFYVQSNVATVGLRHVWSYSPTAGSHLLGLEATGSTATAPTIVGDGSTETTMTIRESLTLSGANATVTSG